MGGACLALSFAVQPEVLWPGAQPSAAGGQAEAVSATGSTQSSSGGDKNVSLLYELGISVFTADSPWCPSVQGRCPESWLTIPSEGEALPLQLKPAHRVCEYAHYLRVHLLKRKIR